MSLNGSNRSSSISANSKADSTGIINMPGITKTQITTEKEKDEDEGSISKKLKTILKKHEGEHQLIIIQDFPDPDALSCAWAYQLIAENYKIKSDIVFGGTVSHQENIALIKLTGLPAKRHTVETLKNTDLSLYQGCVLVDSQGTNTQLLAVAKAANIPLFAAIDHHSKQGELSAEFIDIRPQTRATATILTQYIQQGLLKFDRNNLKHVQCATALMHGLHSDTNKLMQAQEEDFSAAAYLSKFYDPKLLNAVMQSERSRAVMDVIESALKNRTIVNNFSLSGVGYLRYDDRDAIPQGADFLVTEEDIHTTIVYGIIYDEDREVELLVGSLRTTKLTLDPDEFIKEAFGKDPDGKFFGGGRNMAGGFEVPVGFLGSFNNNTDYAKLKWEVFDKQIKHKLLRLVSPDDGAIKTD